MGNTIRHISDQEIVALLQSRDERGIDALYNQYGDYVMGLIFKIIGHNDLSEIVLQDTFLKVWNKIDSFSFEKGRFFSWLMNIARNTAIDMLRSKNYKQMLQLISLESVTNKKESFIMNSRVELLDVRDFVSKLDPKAKVVIELVYFKGYTGSEVANELGIPLGTVKSRIRKGFKDLRSLFAD